MPPDLEPASALASRILESADVVEAAGIIRSRDAAVREPLERRIAELSAELHVSRAQSESLESDLARWKLHGENQEKRVDANQNRIASLEAQLASAREEALREAIAAVEAINADHWATTGGIKARALMVLQSRISFVRNAPPAAQKEPL